MRAVILAAGRGTRLGAAAGGLPKCLVSVGGRALIHRQIDALEAAGVRSILVVVGYKADAVEKAVAGRAETVFNPEFETTNSLPSLLRAAERIDGPFILLHGDMIFDPAIVQVVLKKDGNRLAIDSSSGMDAEHMKVQVADKFIVDMSKEIPPERVSGESVGMLRMEAESACTFFRKGAEIVAAGGRNAYWAAAIKASVGEIPVRRVDISGLAWSEIDTPQDLERARSEILPRISGRRKRILFSGSSRVHFVCCQPIYKRLAADPRIEFWLSGGIKRETPDGRTTYDLGDFYDPFPVDRERVIPIERARQEYFDVYLAANGAKSLFPRTTCHKVQIFHGMSFRNFSAQEKYMRFDTICMAGRYLANIYRRQGLIRPGGPRCLITGFAKDDELVDGSLNREATLRRIGLDPSRPTILFAPTGSLHNAMETMGLDVVRAIGTDGRWNLVVKLHDHPKDTRVDWAEELKPLLSDRVKHVRELNIAPFIHAADLVMTDASSVATEFTLLDRPIVFLDVPELLNEVGPRGGILDLETYGRRIGRLVKKPSEVVAAIADSLAHPEREGELRREVARTVFHDPGNAAERIAGVVLEAAGLSESLPEGVVELEPSEVEEAVGS
jgi:choline kinase